MKLSVTSWSFPHLTLREASHVASALGIKGVDLGLFYAASLDKARLLAEPERYGADIRMALPLAVANYYHLFGADVVARNLAGLPDAQNLVDLKATLRFAKAVGAATVFILPGMINPGQSRTMAIAASAEALKPMVEAGQKAGVQVTIEPHVHGILESVAATLDMLDRVPGLKLTLDPAHFICLGFRQDEIETLAPYAAHVHLRQAKQGHLQTKLETGTINFPAFFGALRDAGYDGWLAIEYVHQTYMNTMFDDVLSETVKMRDCFRNWAAGTVD
jgi:sugar phosphate isomerase/epimerase